MKKTLSLARPRTRAVVTISAVFDPGDAQKLAFWREMVDQLNQSPGASASIRIESVAAQGPHQTTKDGRTG